MPPPNGNEYNQKQTNKGSALPSSDINHSVDGRSSVGGTSAKTHVSKWEKALELSETSSTTHIPKEIEDDVDDMLGCC